MATDILIKRSTTSGAIPTTGDLSTGELAINTADKRLFTNNSGTIVEIGTAPTSLAVTNNATVGGTLDITGDTTVADGTATNWTVSGTLTVSTPSNATDAASKGYVDTADALKVAKAGDTMSGDLAMGTNKVTGLGTPTASTDAATKGYVDAQVTAVIDSAPGALDTLNELAAAINDDANFATTITNSIATKLPLAGGTMTGDITLGANKATSTATPATDDTLTRKGYVDTQDATKLNLSGGTMTGDITLGANQATSTATPTTDDTLTRKGYVDSILGSATDAATSATAAASSATDAANSASAASTSATNAATSASNASTSETNAATSASAASSSATASANSATSAASSATAAATSAAQAAASYDSFDDRYLGSKSSDPTLDNDGNALVTGALYFNSTEGEMRIYDGSVWIAASSASVETMEKFAFTATSGQTVFTGTDDNAKTLALTVGAEMVTLNGVVLEETTDYTRTSDTITLTSGATTGDELNVFAFGNFTVADTVSASTGGTFTGAVTLDGGINGNTNVTGTVTADGLTVDGGNTIRLNAASSDDFLTITQGTSDANISAQSAAGNANLVFSTTTVGTTRQRMDIATNGDISFYEDTGTTPKLFWDASAESLGIGTTTVPTALTVNGSTDNSSYATFGNSNQRQLVLSSFFAGTRNNAGHDFDASGTDGTLSFSTEGSERMRIESDGTVLIGQTTSSGTLGTTTNNGINISGVIKGQINMACNGNPPIQMNRNTSDGSLIIFRQDATIQGTISVSGSTVSYNGGHLARWSQLADNTRDESIVKGTVMSNLDQMAEWTTDGVTEDNEQLNCMKVSDTEGDADVAGVFVNWDNDDDIYTNDMNIAMTGDMVIRIAQGTTVARGDLLMSAGDGTAKPQGDDIVRSKTIAKVTSTHVSHTYDDGSYLVPCVLMAC